MAKRWIMMVFLVVFAAAVYADEPAAAKKINVIIITGADPAHTWKDNAKCVSEILAESGKFDTKTVEDYKILDSAEELAKYDVIVQIGTFQNKASQNKKGFEISDTAKANLLNFVREGKGFYVQHLASSSWENWPEFGRMCGKHWVNGKSGHGRRVPFEAKVVGGDHPITKGLKDFTTDDELYGRFQGSGEVTVLVTGFSPDFSNATEPLVMAHDYGKGHVVVCNFGHDRKAMKTPETRTIIARGIEWAATGKVSESK